MARIAGINIPDNKKILYSLPYIYGIGQSSSALILKSANIDPDKRAKDLTDEELNKIQKILEKNYRVEGDLRREIGQNVKRLKEIGSYRGSRHAKSLPSRGQRTRSNARTKRGKRVTIGAIKKEMAVKMGLATEETKE